MRKRLLAFVAATLMLAAPGAHATPGTCTVTRLDVAGTFPFSNIGGVGLAIPVDIDAATGRFTLDRTAFTTQYPSPGLKFQTGFGPFGWLDWDSGPVEGTIDANGQIVLPNFGMRFWTDFGNAGVPSVAGSMPQATLTNVIQAQNASDRYWLFFGTPVAADGLVHLEGTGFINFQLPLQTGTGLTCRLSPVPTLTDLPKAPTLASMKGKVKPGTDPNAADDTITLKAVLVGGAAALEVDGSQNVVLRFKAGSGLPLNLLVPGGSLQAKGKKLSVKDTDGSVFRAISDRPSTNEEQPPAPAATTGGSLTIKKAKKRMTLALTVSGVEASQLTGSVDATLAVGTQAGTRTLTFVASKKGPKFH